MMMLSAICAVLTISDGSKSSTKSTRWKNSRLDSSILRLYSCPNDRMPTSTCDARSSRQPTLQSECTLQYLSSSSVIHAFISPHTEAREVMMRHFLSEMSVSTSGSAT